MKVVVRILAFSLALVALFCVQFLMLKDDGNVASSQGVSSRSTPTWAENLREESSEPSAPESSRDNSWKVNLREVNSKDHSSKISLESPKVFKSGSKLFVSFPGNGCERMAKSVLRDESTLTILSETKKDSCGDDNPSTVFEIVGDEISSIGKINVDGIQLTVE